MRNNLDRITINPGIRSGKPTIRGTRITVSDILEMLASDMTTEEILSDYPELIKEDIKAALQFAVDKEKINTYISSQESSI